MKIKATKNILVAGAHVDAGEVIETDRQTALHLINICRAVEAPPEEPKKAPPKKKRPAKKADEETTPAQTED